VKRLRLVATRLWLVAVAVVAWELLTRGAHDPFYPPPSTILSGMLFHPSIASHVITSRWGEIYKFIGGAGTIGFFSVFGGLFSIIVLAPSALNSSPAFISDIGGSQNIMAVMAVAVGIAMVATWLTRLGARLDGRWRIGLPATSSASCRACRPVTPSQLSPRYGYLMRIGPRRTE